MIESISSQLKHPKAIYFLSLSRLFERASYYGFRSILMVFMLTKFIQLESTTSSQIYGWFTWAIIITQVFGGALGDFIFGHKKGMLIGGLLQAIGLFVICGLSKEMLYTGMIFIAIGSGLYSPNLLASYGRSYTNTKSQLLDSGFSLLYLAVTFGAFIGSFGVSYFYSINESLAFAFCGGLMIISVVLSFFSENEKVDSPTTEIIDSQERSFAFVKVVLAVLLLGIFWFLYDSSYGGVLTIQTKFYEIGYGPMHEYGTVSGILTTFFSIVFAIFWAFYYYRRFFKMLIGFLMAAFAFLLLLMMPEKVTDSSYVLFIASALFMTLAEVHLSPIIYATISRNIPSKYLATAFGLSFVPSKLFYFVVGGMTLGSFFSDENGFVTSMIASAFIGLLLLGYWIINRNKSNNYKHIK